MSTFAVGSITRSATGYARCVRLSAWVKTRAASSPVLMSSRKPLSARIIRSPVEMSSISVVSMLPHHTATASALLTSMLSVAPCGHGWIIEDCSDDN